jgi:hypothetical protein
MKVTSLIVVLAVLALLTVGVAADRNTEYVPRADSERLSVAPAAEI